MEGGLISYRNRCFQVFCSILAAVLPTGGYVTGATQIALGRSSAHLPRLTHSLGVEHARLFAKAPVLGEEKVVLLDVWLKRISDEPSIWSSADGAVGRGPSFMLPAQTPSIEGFAFAEDIARINMSRFNLMETVVDMHVWQPRLWLERADGNATAATPHPFSMTLDGAPFTKPWTHHRAVSFFFPLDIGNASGHCFKIYEASMPDYKAPVCLQLSSANLCHHLAPPSRFTPASPALWTAMVPFRSMGVEGPRWAEHMRLSANRIHNYLSYYRAIGATGLLLYADRLTAEGLEPHVQDLLRAGTLVLVAWDNIERMQYNYDMVLVYSHAFLGLASCGTNLWLQTTDVDELLYNVYGKPWPDIFDCLLRTSGDQAAGMFRIQRIDVVTSRMSAGQEAALWSGQRLGREESFRKDRHLHPLELYDRIARQSFSPVVGKIMACPARRIVASWVHTALPLYGAWYEGNVTCAFILHLPNYWTARRGNSSSEFDPYSFRGPWAARVHGIS